MKNPAVYPKSVCQAALFALTVSPFARRILGLVSAKHDSRQSTRPSVWDVGFTIVYGLVPLVLILAAGGPVWAAILVALASTGIGFWRQ